MTSGTSSGSKQPPPSQTLPSWIVAGVLGLVVGGGLTFLGLQFLGYSADQISLPAANAAGGPSAGAGGMGGGGMGGGGMGGGGMGGGGSTPRGKRNLTTLVAKLDLASKGIPFQLDQKQSSALAEQLVLLEQSDKMTQDEAQERCDALEEMLTGEQKETLASFELPRAGRGGGGGGPAGGGPPPGGAPGGAAPDDGNPFQEDANQSRLRSLLDRLKDAGGEQ